MSLVAYRLWNVSFFWTELTFVTSFYEVRDIVLHSGLPESLAEKPHVRAHSPMSGLVLQDRKHLVHERQCWKKLGAILCYPHQLVVGDCVCLGFSPESSWDANSTIRFNVSFNLLQNLLKVILIHRYGSSQDIFFPCSLSSFKSISHVSLLSTLVLLELSE